MGKKLPKELVAASATPLILSILARGESYGYAIIGEVRRLSAGDLEWAEGMLYPILHRLEQQGLVKATWKQGESGRRRKYYRLNRKGETALSRWRDQWLSVHSTLTTAWEGI